MASSTDLALLGGHKAIGKPLPHEVWPPPAGADELQALATQRQTDIRISGNAGPVGELEGRFLEFLDGKVRFAIGYNSGTSALLAAYFGCKIGVGDEVIGPDLTYHAALSPIYMLGASIVLADIDMHSRCIDVASVEPLITEATKAIVAVHQWGHPADVESLLKLRDKYGLKLIEDCSHAHGSRYRGRACGTFGDAAVFSLQANKAIFAGEGGMLVTSNAEIKDRAVLLGHYRDRARADVEDAGLSRYAETGAGLKLRMSPFNAIVALAALQAFPEVKSNRHRCLHYLNEGLQSVPYLAPTHIDEDIDMGAWYGFKPLYDPDVLGVERDTLIRALRAEGMEVGTPSGPQLSTQPLYQGDPEALLQGPKRRENDSVSQPRAQAVAARALSLPTFSSWSQDKDVIDEYLAAFDKVWKHRAALQAWEVQSRTRGSSERDAR